MVFQLFLGVLDFLILAFILSVVLLVLSKIFFPVRKKIEEKFSLDWLKSSIITNFLIIFFVILVFYLYFFLIAGFSASPTEPELAYDFFETSLMLALGAIRILFVSIILSLVVLFFEILSSFVVDQQEEKKYSPILKNFFGIFVSSMVFLFLLFFIFDWVPLGIFVYIFYGSLSEAPLLLGLLSSFELLLSGVSL